MKRLLGFLRDYVVLAAVCLACTAVIAFVVMPVYMATGVIRNFGLAKLPSDRLGWSDIRETAWFLTLWGVLFLAPLLVLFRDQLRAVFFASLVFCPFSNLAPIIVFITDSHGTWWRGPLNAPAYLSLPCLQFLLSVVVLRRLRRENWLS